MIENDTKKEEETKIDEILEVLKNWNIPYELKRHEPLYTMEACKEVEKELNTYVPKNLFLCNRQETKFYLLFMPGDKTFLTKELSSQIHSARLSFAKEEYLENMLHVKKGSCTPLGLYFDKEQKIQFLIDKEILKNEYVGIHPLVNTGTIKIKLQDLLDVFLKKTNHNYQVVELLGQEQNR